MADWLGQVAAKSAHQPVDKNLMEIENQITAQPLNRERFEGFLCKIEESKQANVFEEVPK